MSVECRGHGSFLCGAHKFIVFMLKNSSFELDLEYWMMHRPLGFMKELRIFLPVDWHESPFETWHINHSDVSMGCGSNNISKI